MSSRNLGPALFTKPAKSAKKRQDHIQLFVGAATHSFHLKFRLLQEVCTFVPAYRNNVGSIGQSACRLLSSPSFHPPTPINRCGSSKSHVGSDAVPVHLAPLPPGKRNGDGSVIAAQFAMGENRNCNSNGHNIFKARRHVKHRLHQT